MEAATQRVERQEEGALRRLATRVGAPSLAAIGTYLTLQLLLAQNSRPAAIAIGLAGVVTTNGVAVWLGGQPRSLRLHPTGNVTFLFTDIEGSTEMWEHSPEDMCLALRRHDLILRTVIGERGGFVFATTGDGIGVAFECPTKAIDAALAAQQALCAETWPSGLSVRVRMGIHLGEAEERDGDYFGPPVNRAARVMSVATPGSVVVTDDVVEALGSDHTIVFTNLGFHRLRGVSGRTRLHQARRTRGCSARPAEGAS